MIFYFCKVFLVYVIWSLWPLNRKAEQRLLNPTPGSTIEAARKFGIDLTLLIEQPRLTPDQRIRKLQQAMYMVSELRSEYKR